MREIFKLFAVIFGLIVMVCGQLLTTYLSPRPFDNFNVIFFILILYLIFRESGLVVYLSLVAHFTVELYTITPFGIVLYASTISFLVGYWLYRSVFTNKSWYSAIILSFMMVGFFRLLYLVMVWVGGYASVGTTQLMLGSFAYEAIFTSCAVGLVVFVSSRLSFRLSPSVLNKRLFRPK